MLTYDVYLLEVSCCNCSNLLLSSAELTAPGSRSRLGQGPLEKPTGSLVGVTVEDDSDEGESLLAVIIE